ncbi:glycosyltransferase [Pseudodesulfovibrio tunisiensis]|uniref:glycosyltransferase n=1 Tax=Pseudodesulfovibrio tunisiensis TaxID=463192 RepID=UPI001FB1F351|nr:glycosyltransferase [Pseudodesulfovibrio tunisiensis]
MNIAFVNSTHKWGGVKTWCLDMGKAMRNQGHEIWIYGRPGPFVDKAEELGLHAQAVSFGPDLHPGLIFRFFREFRRNRIDLVVVNISKDLRSAGIAARLLDIPMVQHLGAPGDVANRFKTRITQRLLAPKLMACSEFVRHQLKNAVPLFASCDFKAIHPGVEIGAAPHPPGNPRTIIATTQLEKNRGHEDLLNALALAKNAGLSFHCIIAGTGNYETTLQKKADLLGLTKEMEWTGFVSNIRSLLKRADLFVLPTYVEGLGIALEEAMAEGLVPIARRAGGPPEIWPETMPHLLVNPTPGPEGILAALEHLLALPDDELMHLKQQAQSKARQAFPIDRQARIFLEWAIQKSC